MRLFRDRPDVLTPGRWYWCPPGAKVIPYAHLFGTFWQEPDEQRIDPTVGEVPVWHGFADGLANPRYTGQNWCGGEEVWTRGALYSQRGTPAVDAQGVPFCCQSLAALPGGSVDNGSATYGVRYFLRSDEVPPQDTTAATVLASWTNQGTPITPVFLDRQPGNSANAMPFNLISLGFAPPRQVAALQYLTAPLQAAAIDAQTVTVTAALEVTSCLNGALGLLAAVVLVDGATLTAKAVLTGPVGIGASGFATYPTRGFKAELPIPGFVADEGDCLALELGLAIADEHVLGHQYAGAFVDAGLVEVLSGGHTNFNPRTLLAGVLPVEDLDVPLPGTLVPYAGLTVPAGYLPCDGASYLRTAFPALFAAIGAAWGAVDGAHFNVPDLRDRVPVGTSPGGLPLRPTVRAVADAGGEEAHVLATAELASHGHNLTDPGHLHTITDPGHNHTPQTGGQFGTNDSLHPGTNSSGGANAWSTTTSTEFTGITIDPTATGVTVDAAGGGAGHNNMQPFAVVAWLIKT